MDSYLTEKQIKVLKLMVQGLTVDEIASKLGTSKSNIYYIIRSARKSVEKSRNTIRIYEEIMGNRRINIRSGSKVDEVINTIINSANKEGIKVDLTTAELVRKIVNTVGVRCLDIINWVVNCDLSIILGDRDLSMVASGEV